MQGQGASDTPHYENVPFEVPTGWCWIRLKDIASFGGGKTPSMENKEYWDNGTHLWVTSKDMKTSVINDSMMKISDEALKTMQVHQPGTLLMVTRSGILRRMLPLAILEKKATVNQDLKTIRIVTPILPIYVFYTILANESMILRDYHKDGTTVDSINFDKFVEMPIPLPPQNEQKRIVDEIEHYLSLIEDIKHSEDDIIVCIDSAKSKILDLAIHGKLVSQDANDEPASELLKRINPNAVASCDNPHYEDIPFELPESWKWLKHNDVIEISGGSQPPKSNFITIPKTGYIRLYQIRDYGERPSPVYIPISQASKIANPGDILLARYGASLGKVFKAEYGAYNVAMAKVVERVKGLFDIDFLFLYYHTELYRSTIFSVSRSAQNGFNKTDLEAMYIPIPPIAEQHRIVSKVNELFSQLDMIEKSLQA